MQKNSKTPLYGIIILVVAGGIIGAKYLSLFFNGNIFPGVLFGMLISFTLGYIFSHELRERFKSSKHKKLSNRVWGGFSESFIHPTNLPLYLAMLWFLFFGVLFPSETKGNGANAFLFQPILFLFGLSGFQLLRLKEGVGRLGRKYYGFWVYFNGILAILFGWGFLLAYIFF
jgi:hypothetical protein